jgi:uncharacterized membrane protein YjdF
VIEQPSSVRVERIPPEASRGPAVRALALAASVGRRLTPLDVFAAVNLVLFVFMCVFTYYARFIAYRGAANVWEFFVYASAIIGTIAFLWFFFRRYGLGATLLALIQLSILIHFAGAFIRWDGHRLYDCFIAGIRYDKFVHFTNAIVAALVVRHIFVRRGMRLDGLTRLFILLVVLGLGAIVEIIEYIVCTTIPGNGVGGYDNNMQDLIANLVGTTICVVSLRSAPRRPRLRLADVGARRWPQAARSRASFERTLSAVEVVALPAICLSMTWMAPWLVVLPGFVPVAQLVLCAALAYLLYLSPVRLHGDSLAERGLGSWRTLFVRTDNVAAAARRFGLLALAGTTGILLLAAVWNPGWLAKANWKAWGVRLTFYSLSASIQALVFVGFFLVRLQRVIRPSRATIGTTVADDRRRRLLISVVAGLVFGAIHAPGIPLMALAAIFGFASAWICLRTPNVIVAAACHGLLGLLVHRILELPFRVGPFYNHPDVHVLRSLVPLATRWIGGLY